MQQTHLCAVNMATIQHTSIYFTNNKNYINPSKIYPIPNMRFGVRGTSTHTTSQQIVGIYACITTTDNLLDISYPFYLSTRR